MQTCEECGSPNPKIEVNGKCYCNATCWVEHGEFALPLKPESPPIRDFGIADRILDDHGNTKMQVFTLTEENKNAFAKQLRDFTALPGDLERKLNSRFGREARQALSRAKREIERQRREQERRERIARAARERKERLRQRAEERQNRAAERRNRNPTNISVDARSGVATINGRKYPIPGGVSDIEVRNDRIFLDGVEFILPESNSYHPDLHECLECGQRLIRGVEMGIYQSGHCKRCIDRHWYRPMTFHRALRIAGFKYLRWKIKTYKFFGWSLPPLPPRLSDGE